MEDAITVAYSGNAGVVLDKKVVIFSSTYLAARVALPAGESCLRDGHDR